MIRSVVTVALLAPCLLSATPGRPPADKPAASKLDGAWRLVGVKGDPNAAELSKLPDGFDQHKLVVGGRFVWTLVKDGRAVSGAGGKAAVTDDEYVEEIEYTLTEGNAALVGKKAKFTWKLDGDKWTHKGTIKVDDGELRIDEVWERVK